MPVIEITFNVQTGEAKVDAQGFTGPACKDATKFLRDTLGECRDWQAKGEYYEVNLNAGLGLHTNYCG